MSIVFYNILLMLHLTPKNPLFPKELLNIPQPPRELFIEGNWADLLAKPKVAVIGSRKVSNYGRIVTERLTQTLVTYGIAVVSGLAFGVDSIAHTTALVNGGPTIAILPNGLDNICPASHTQLAHQIVKQGGALISEYSPRSQFYKSNLIARNRLVAGLCQAVLITEAGERSGSLHTASFAIDGGKEVLVVPGPITSPSSIGCNNLIKSGATMITGPSDLLNALNIQAADLAVTDVIAANEDEYQILKLIKEGIKDGDELQQQSGLSPSKYLEVMSFLEISGRIKALGGNQWDLNS
jgi:DNA processing protein